MRVFFMLAYISQANYIEQYFIPAFNAAKAVLAADQNSDFTRADIIALCAECTWGISELNKYYITAFHRLAKTLASLVRN